MVENFYRNWFIDELEYFQKRKHINPTHCIIEPKIYNDIINENIRNNYNHISDFEKNKFENQELSYLGIIIKKGNGSQQFNFFEEVK